MLDREAEAIARRLSGSLPQVPDPRPSHRDELWQRLQERHQTSPSSRPGPTESSAPAGQPQPIRYTLLRLPPLGEIYLGYTEQGICFLTNWVHSEAEFAQRVQLRYGCGVVRDDSRQVRWQAALERWLAGRSPDVPLDLSRLTAFEQKVLKKAAEISRGAVRPYQWLAREVGSPKASRAVGNVMARNPVPLLLPCHRVVAASGELGHYSMGGPAMKRQLLELEGVDVDRIATLARKGYRYKASRTTGVYCYPTCRAIRPDNELLFRSPGEAEAAGFRPCKLCRPG